MKISDLVDNFTSLSRRNQLALIERVREDRATSKAIQKRTTPRQRSNAVEKLKALLDGMSAEQRVKWLSDRS